MLESIKEELQRMKADRLIIIVCLIMPICINLLIGWELSKGVIDNIPMAVVDHDNSQLSRQIIQYFAANDSFNLNYYVESQEELEDLLSTSKVKVGMVIPKNFSQDVTSLRSPGLLMLYDASHMSITSSAKAKASEILLTIRAGATIKQLEARLNMTDKQAYHTAMPISFVSRTLYNPAKNFQYFMQPGYGTIVCQTGIGLTAVLCINFLIEENKKRSILGYTIGKIFFYGMMGSLAFIVNILCQIYLFKIPYKGSLVMGMFLSILLAFAISAMSVAISAWFKNRVLAMAITGLLLIPNSIMAGYTWPVISMIPLYQKVSYIIPFYHYGDNIRNLFLRGNLQNVTADIRFLIVFMISMSIIAVAGIIIEPHIKLKGVFKK